MLSRSPKFGHLMTPIAVSANCDVKFGNWVNTSLQTRSHRRRDSDTGQNCYVSNIFRTTENCLDCRELISHQSR